MNYFHSFCLIFYYLITQFLTIKIFLFAFYLIVKYKVIILNFKINNSKTNVKFDKQSSKNGGGYSLRYKPTKKEKENIIKSGICKILCSEDYFKNAVENSKYNKGEIFEKMITEKSGQVWEKDNIPFYKGADLTTNNIAYSIKFEKATICTENILNKLK